MARDPFDAGTIEIDYGDPELNDPDYEKNVGGDDATEGDASADSDAQGDAQAGTGDASDAGADDGGAGTGAGGAGGAQGQRPAPVGGTRADEQGNLVDAQGNIVAAAGAERRHYERVQQQSRYIKALERDLEQARGGASMAGVLNDMPTRMGLDMRETELGLQIVSSFKKDPVATARWALQETMRMGYNLAQIVGADAEGKPLSGSMDLQAVRSMINEAVAPLVGDRQATARENQAAAEAERDYSAFIAKHEFATVHDEALANMLAGDDALTPEAAYWQLVAFAARNDLDFSKPLRPQVLAREQGQQPAPNGNAQPPSAQRYMAMPNGSMPTSDMRQSDGMAAPDASWDSIVQQSLRDAGFR